MVVEDSGGKWKKIIFIVIGILVLIAILITLFVGLRSLKTFFVWVLGTILGIIILFGLAYAFWLIFFKKHFIDIPATYKKKLVQVSKMMKNEMLGDLYLSGDEKHNRIKIGKFAYLRMTLPRQEMKKIENKNKSDKPFDPNNPNKQNKQNQEEEVTRAVPVDAFIILKKGIIENLFGDPIVILVKPEDHNHTSIFNDVTIRGFNLVPIDSQFYTIDRRQLDIDIIKGMSTSYIREVVYEIFRDLDKLVKQAMNLDQQFQKDKQKGLEFEIPQLPQIGGGQQQR